MPAKDASVVSVDKIHPDWQAQLDAVRATAARRAARRIVFRQVNGTLQPVGITSARDVALAAQAAEAGLGGDGIAIEVPSGGRRSGRRRPTDGASYLQSLGMTGADLEAMMIAEAMRLSLADEEDRQRRDQQQGSSSTSAPSASAAAAAAQPSLSVRTDAPTAVPARTSSATPVSANVTPRAESRPPLRTADSTNSVHSSLNYEPMARDDDNASLISTGESIVPLRPRTGSTAGSLASSHR